MNRNEAPRKFPLVVDLKRYSAEDGPGIRTVVFFKGCPLRCVFCQNPETWDPRPEIAYHVRDCIGCGACSDVCPQSAIDRESDTFVRRDACNRCAACVSACPGKGLRLVGTYYCVDDLVRILLQDSPYYRYSGGGVTLSGGECTLYTDYVGSLLEALKEEGIHTTIETSGFFDYGRFSARILPHVNLVYYDLKIADCASHILHIGRPNRLIISNFRRLMTERPESVHTRIPLIPGVTATEENLSAIVGLLKACGAEDVSLLPYNPCGLEKYPRLGKPIPPLPRHFMQPREEESLCSLFAKLIRERA